MAKGVIYVLTNPSFPEYVKIGYADNLEKRLKEFNNSACLPFAFRVYCIYEVNERLKDRDVHSLIDKLNPELRAIETFDGKPRIREFYNISAEDAYEILYKIASISGTLDRLRKMNPEGHEILDEKMANEIRDTSEVCFTEEKHLSKGTNKTRSLYDELKRRIISFGNISIEPRKFYIAFKSYSNICDVVIQKNKLQIALNLPEGKLQDPQNMAKDVSSKGHWGNGDYIIYIENEGMLDYSTFLIRQAYDYRGLS